MSALDDDNTGSAYQSPARPPGVPSSDSEPELVHRHDEEHPTASHALADESKHEELDMKGSCQLNHNEVEVKNLGWNDDVSNIPQPLVGGLSNEKLWTLLRRFDKQIFHVKSIDEPPLANLDLNIADNEEFSPDKLRAQLERLYMVVILSLLSAWKHIVRLRSWKEGKRTAIFLGVYSLAWLLDLLIPTFTIVLMILIIHPPFRAVCFPPAPPSLIDPTTGGVQKPPAGVLASDDSFTGAPEKHQGEAVEQEAHSFVNSISSLIISTAAGKHPQGDPHEDNSAPDPSEVTEDLALSKDKTDGEISTHEHNRTKAPVSQAVWNRARPAMHAMADLVDTWERFQNALNPKPPFPKDQPRLVLVSSLAPLLVASYFTSSYLLVKSAGFGVGFGFFGAPIINPVLEFINTKMPGWRQYLQLRHSILRGVPTNAQLLLTLLRIGEKNNAPIPPPPVSNIPAPVRPHDHAGENLDHLGATEEEIEEAIQPDENEGPAQTESDTKPKTSRRILNLLKGTTKGGIQTALTADKAKAKAGARHARERLGVVKGKAQTPPRGPVSFPARFKGKKGRAYITSKATSPALSWTSNINDVNPAWTVSIGDIAELKKVGGLGWKSKIVVGWALGSEIVDGLVVKTKRGDELHLTAISTRDALFNRLIAMGSQMWEAW